MIENIKVRPIEELKEFTKKGHTFKRIGYNETLNIYLYERQNQEGKPIAWEVIKPPIKQGIYCYPSDEQFGIYGRYFPMTEALRPKMIKYFQEGW